MSAAIQAANTDSFDEIQQSIENIVFNQPTVVQPVIKKWYPVCKIRHQVKLTVSPAITKVERKNKCPHCGTYTKQRFPWRVAA